MCSPFLPAVDNGKLILPVEHYIEELNLKYIKATLASTMVSAAGRTACKKAKGDN